MEPWSRGSEEKMDPHSLVVEEREESVVMATREQKRMSLLLRHHKGHRLRSMRSVEENKFLRKQLALLKGARNDLA